MRPCRICNSTKKSELNRHHLLPKGVRKAGTRQITIKLCKDGKGCTTHRRFHQGDREAAQDIRAILDLDELVWMVDQVGVEWVNTIYPSRTVG